MHIYMLYARKRNKTTRTARGFLIDRITVYVCFRFANGDRVHLVVISKSKSVGVAPPKAVAYKVLPSKYVYSGYVAHTYRLRLRLFSLPATSLGIVLVREQLNNEPIGLPQTFKDATVQFGLDISDLCRVGQNTLLLTSASCCCVR